MSKKAGISKERGEWLRRRSEAFARATQRKGMPMVFGSGVPPKKK